MSDFTIKVFADRDDPTEPSDLRTVGRSLETLSRELATLVDSGTAQIHRSVDMAAYTAQRDSWTGDARAAAEALFNALSFRLYAADGSVEKEVGHKSDPEDKKVHDHIELIFVFEDEGQMIVPVPAAKLIARGLENAPLKIPSVYDALVPKNTVRALMEGMQAARQRAQNDGGALGTLSEQQMNAVLTALAEIARDLGTDVDTDAVFFEQLGDYSVRQCAG